MKNTVDKIEMELKPFETMCEEITSHLKELVTCSECVDSMEIKTVAEVLEKVTDVKKDIVEMNYKKKIIEAMEEEEDDSMRMGYNDRRYSNGRYAPRMGYDHMMEDDSNYRMGYKAMDNGRYGRAYNEYRTAKRNYTETGDPHSKSKMNEASRDHLNDTIATMKEMWDDADPMMKNQMKHDLQNLLQNMVV